MFIHYVRRWREGGSSGNVTLAGKGARGLLGLGNWAPEANLQEISPHFRCSLWDVGGLAEPEN